MRLEILGAELGPSNRIRSLLLCFTSLEDVEDVGDDGMVAARLDGVSITFARRVWSLRFSFSRRDMRDFELEE